MLNFPTWKDCFYSIVHLHSLKLMLWKPKLIWKFQHMQVSGKLISPTDPYGLLLVTIPFSSLHLHPVAVGRLRPKAGKAGRCPRRIKFLAAILTLCLFYTALHQKRQHCSLTKTGQKSTACPDRHFFFFPTATTLAARVYDQKRR